MYIQLVGSDDPSVDEGCSALARWREYVDTFVMHHPTEWVKAPEKDRSRLFLRRQVNSYS
jgi:paired amphipathic helix protein Sin3a